MTNDCGSVDYPDACVCMSVCVWIRISVCVSPGGGGYCGFRKFSSCGGGGHGGGGLGLLEIS